jgi:hypothetical protein
LQLLVEDVRLAALEPVAHAQSPRSDRFGDQRLGRAVTARQRSRETSLAGWRRVLRAYDKYIEKRPTHLSLLYRLCRSGDAQKAKGKIQTKNEPRKHLQKI